MKEKNEKGSLVIEAVIVCVVTIMVIFGLMVMSILIYEKQSLQILADETAVEVANIYSNLSKDPFYGYVNSEEFYNTDLYRNLFKDSTYETQNITKAKWYAAYRMADTMLLEGKKEPEITVKIVDKPSDIMVKQMAVTLKKEYDVPILGYFGIDKNVTFEATGYADCYDMIEYINFTDLVVDGAKKLEETFGVDKIGDAAANFRKAVAFLQKLF